MFDSTGLNYNTFVQELFTSSSLGTTSSNHGINSRGADPHQGGGEGFLDLANAQTMIDSDAIAMWSNAPSGFEYVISSFEAVGYPFVNLCVQFRRLGSLFE